MNSPPRQGSCENASTGDSDENTGLMGSAGSAGTRNRSTNTRAGSPESTETSTVSLLPRSRRKPYPAASGASGADIALLRVGQRYRQRRSERHASGRLPVPCQRRFSEPGNVQPGVVGLVRRQVAEMVPGLLDLLASGYGQDSGQDEDDRVAGSSFRSALPGRAARADPGDVRGHSFRHQSTSPATRKRLHDSIRSHSSEPGPKRETAWPRNPGDAHPLPGDRMRARSCA